MAPSPHAHRDKDGALIANTLGWGGARACSSRPSSVWHTVDGMVQRGSSAGCPQPPQPAHSPPAGPAVTCSLLQLQPQALLQQLQGNLLPCSAGSPEVQGDLIDGVAPKIAADTEGVTQYFPQS